LRAFWLTLFAIGAAAVLVGGWRSGEPWTAAAFVVFFVSRVWRSLVKRPLSRPIDEDPVRRANRFIAVTAAGWFGSGVLAAVAALAGEGQEWLYIAPCFLVMGAIQLYVLFSRWQA
jgi:hypothetical protein